MKSLWVALATSALTTITRAQIRILAPESLKRGFEDTKQVIVGSTSTFGAPFYGERVTGRLRHGYSKGNHHCTAGDYDLVDEPGGHGTDYMGERALDIVLVRVGGGCGPVTKVLVAEQKDAHAVIFIDDTDKTPKEISEVLLPDDGEGSTVRIPSILVSKRQGEMLLNAMVSDRVVVELSWDIPQSQAVTVDFWFSSGSLEATAFLKRFTPVVETLGDKLKFVPHYDVFDLPAGGNVASLCSDLIDSGVKHCAPDPDGPGPITGADVANEDVRQLCLYKQTENDNVYPSAWWDYVTSIHDKCPMEGPRNARFGSEYCSITLMSILDLTKHSFKLGDVQSCWTFQAGKLLEKEAEETAWSELALRINGWRYRGPLDPETVLKAICSGYAEEPLECRDALANALTKIMHSFVRYTATLSNRSFYLLMTAILLTSIANCFLYRRYIQKLVRSQMREEVMLEVQSQMADYSKLEDRGGRR